MNTIIKLVAFSVLPLGFNQKIFAQCRNIQLYCKNVSIENNNCLWINCAESEGVMYNLQLASPNNIQNYLIDFGDDSPIVKGNLWKRDSVIEHKYGHGKFEFTITEFTSKCTNRIKGTVINVVDNKISELGHLPVLEELSILENVEISIVKDQDAPIWQEPDHKPQQSAKINTNNTASMIGCNK